MQTVPPLNHINYFPPSTAPLQLGVGVIPTLSDMGATSGENVEPTTRMETRLIQEVWWVAATSFDAM
jgi:hypothetical protein